jgi:uncharacterized protein
MNPRLRVAPAVGSGDPLDRESCLALLARGSVGRLVFTDRALPDVLPVPYRMDGERILLKLATGTTACTASLETVVAYTVDDVDVGAGSGWSVTAVGYAHEIVAPDGRTHELLTELVPWQWDTPTSLVSISTQRVTGCQWSPTPRFPASAAVPVGPGEPPRI